MKNTKRKTKTTSLVKHIKEKLRRRNLGVVVTTTPIVFLSRKLARSMAKANMKKAGMQHVNSCMRYANWREWAWR